MPNPFGAPEISPSEVEKKREKGDDFLLVDVREPFELNYARISGDNIVLLPLSRLAKEGPAAVPDEMKDQSREAVIFCHHGVRSAQVVAWLQGQGWEKVSSLKGGIHLYASEVDDTIGFY